MPLIKISNHAIINTDFIVDVKVLAELSYQLADAMIVERGKG